MTYPHNIKEINKAEINEPGMKRCSECPFGEEINNLCGAYRCTTDIGGSYSFNEGCSFLSMVKNKCSTLHVSPKLELKFSSMNYPSDVSEDDNENIAPEKINKSKATVYGNAKVSTKTAFTSKQLKVGDEFKDTGDGSVYTIEKNSDPLFLNISWINSSNGKKLNDTFARDDFDKGVEEGWIVLVTKIPDITINVGDKFENITTRTTYTVVSAYDPANPEIIVTKVHEPSLGFFYKFSFSRNTLERKIQNGSIVRV